MRFFRSLFLLVSLITIMTSSLYLPGTTTSAQTPYTILGHVFDVDEAGIMDVTVLINNTRNNVSQEVLTDSLGRYSLDMTIDSGHDDVHEGDALVITAIYHNHSSTETLTVELVPYQQQNLTLNFRAHVIDGYVRKAVDGTAARYFNVHITNENTTESEACLTDTGGYYRTELSTFPGGFAQGDGILVSVYQQEFSGGNYTSVSSNPGDRMNITIFDEIDPVFRDGKIYEAPESVNLSQEFRILAWVTDMGSGVAGVKLFMKKDGESIYTAYNMIRDDGSANDWNGNGVADFQIWGQSTHMDLPVQTDLGDLFYYINATDASGNYATLPADNPRDNPLRIKVIDHIMPTLAHTPISRVEAGMPREIIATADDNVAVDEVNLFVRGVGQTGFSEIRMMPTGDPKQYNASIPAQYELGILEYYLTCNDTSNNTVRLPESGAWAVEVEDTTVPKITHTKINSANVGDPINITCRVFDTFLDTVWLNYTDVHGDDTHNHTMAHDAGTEDRYYFEIPGQDATGIFHYTIWANDTSGNIAKVSHAFLVLDVGSPMIVHEPPEFLEFGQPVQIHAYAEDDVKLEFVNLSYLPVGGTEFISTIMDKDDPSVDTHGNYSAEIPVQTALGTVRYNITATDGFNNITWPSVNPPYAVPVLDTIPPAFSGLAYPADAPSDLGADVLINVTDAHSVASVKLYYLNSTAAYWASIEMASDGPATYKATIPPHSPGQVKFYIRANDSSNNTATLPAETPKLNSFLMNFTDDSPPRLELIIPDTVGVNRTAEVFLNATDDTAVTSVELYFKGTEDTAFGLLELSKTGPDSYISAIPKQMSSGQAEIYASASDGTNINQTEVLKITVVNSPPKIQHTPPGTVPVDATIAITAMVSDDLRVEGVNLEWRRPGEQSTVVAMQPRAGDFYRADISFPEIAVFEYRIIAHDAETTAQWPETGYHELIVSDMEPPVILHPPLQNLTTAEMPIFTATVTDDRAVESVVLWYRNSTSEAFTSVVMSPVSGTDDFATILGRQPEGNLSYYIEATDGVNTARSPITGYHSVYVEGTGGGWVPMILLAVLMILLVVAAILILMHLRGKPINDVAESGDDRIEDNENP